MFDFDDISLDLNADTEHLRSPLFSMKGKKDGPRLVVAGPDDTVRALAEMFWDLPDIVNMRGSLVLRDDTQDPAFDLPDAVLTLRTSRSTEAFLQTLGRMTALGMITGRGVPRRWVA